MKILSIACAVSCLAAPAQAQTTGPANTLQDMRPALWACWQPPEGVSHFQVTVVFTLTRSGSVLGKPRITYSRFSGDADEQRRIMSAILGALDACTPVNVTDSLGGAIAGRPFTMTFTPRSYRS
ncbi:hypothetical protein [Microvirga pudoricolor]|uniref:hypothetical protein n=1 Tax=Microvirga pudoricolor TaxID=2778729 RepID=UPI00195195AA|nr:hypothetical protein [Microvirga pudoricolor]MBM6594275.1 hypothetical protein [Microvirga pudoricolor]